MLHHTRGIVLHHLRYSETSVIARIYTEMFGLQSYLIRGVRKPKARIRLGLLERLTLLEMVVYYREGKSLQNIRELRPAYVFRSMHSDIRKSSQALFINEVIFKSVKEEERNTALFDFLFACIEELDNPRVFLPHFHLAFMARLAGFLGFAPQLNYTPHSWFNLQEGHFEEKQPLHSHYIAPEHARYFNFLLNKPAPEDPQIMIPGSSRKVLLEKLIEFYELHLPSFGGLHTPEILHEVLKD